MVRPSDRVSWYPMMGVSPVAVGGVHCKPTAVPLGRALRLVGAAATTPARGGGVTAAAGRDGALAPGALTACTVTTYGVPFVSPEIVTYPSRAKSAALTLVCTGFGPPVAVTRYPDSTTPLSA